MAFSGARGNISQVRQLVGMRGLMADPNGEIIDLPITANFREGLKITDYLISSFGARKGLVDTALKTADSGYLTRRLVDVAQDIIIREMDCNTKRGIHLHITDSSLINEQLIGRILAEDLILNDNLKFEKGQELSFEITDNLIPHIPFDIYVYSSLTCMSVRSICQKCYGWNLATNKLVQLGEAVGVLAAQSIGEPGTQLTMRTFHTGGVFTGSFGNQIRAQASGQVIFAKQLKLILFRTDLGKKAYLTQNSGEIYLKTYTNKILTIPIQSDTILFIENYSYVKSNFLIGELSSKKEAKALATKELKATNSGEIYLDPKYFSSNTSDQTDSSGILWLFTGNLYKIPYSSYLNLEENRTILKNQAFLKTKITSKISGKHCSLTTDKNNFETRLKISSKENILNYIKLCKNNVETTKSFKKYFLEIFDLSLNLLLFKNKNFVNSELIGQSFLNQHSFIWNQENITYYQSQNCSRYKNLLPILNSKPPVLETGYVVNVNLDQKIKSLNLKQISNSEITILDFFQKQIFRTSLKSFSLEQLKMFSDKKNFILYPGEQLIENYNITIPCLVTKQIKKGNLVFCVHALEFYRLPNYEENLKKLNLTLTLTKQFSPLLRRKTSKKALELDLVVKNNDVNASFPNSNEIFGSINFSKQNDEKINFVFQKEEIINLANYENSISEEEQLKLNLIVKNNEDIKEGTTLGYYELLSSSNQEVKNWKLRQKDNLYLFLTTENDYHRVFAETSQFNIKRGILFLKIIN